MTSPNDDEWGLVLRTSSKRKQEVYYKYEFYRSAAFNSGLVTFAGFLFTFSVYLLLQSVLITTDISSDSWNSGAQIGIALILSYAGVWFLGQFRELENISYIIRQNQANDSQEDWPGSSSVIVACISLILIFGWGSLKISEIAAQESLWTSLEQLIYQGGIINFIIHLLTYLTLAGSILTVVSLFATIRYMVYPYFRGVRAAVRRILYHIGRIFVSEDIVNEGRELCDQCYSDKKSTNDEGEKLGLYCAFCGLKLGECTRT